MVFSFDSCMKYVDNLDTTNSLEEGDASSMNRRELVTWFVTSFFAMGTQSVLAQENGKEREKPTISMEDFMKELNEKSTYNVENLEDFLKWLDKNISLIRNMLDRYELSNNDIREILKEIPHFHDISPEKLGEVTHELFKKGWYLNMRNSAIWGMLLQKWLVGPWKLNDSDVSKRIFGESISDTKVLVMVINDPNFLFLWATDPYTSDIVLNQVNILSGHKSYLDLMKTVSNPIFSKMMDSKSYLNIVLVNELCHGVLNKKYNFHNFSNITWKQELGGHYLEGVINNQSIWEFLSDTLSLLWWPIEQSLVLAIIRSIYIHHEWYRFSNGVLYTYIHEVFSKKTTKNSEINYVLDTLSQVLRGQNTQVQASKLFSAILNNLDKEDVPQIVEYFISDAQRFISIIKKHAPKK